MTNYQPLFKKWGMSIVSPVFFIITHYGVLTSCLNSIPTDVAALSSRGRFYKTAKIKTDIAIPISTT
jgi:hypothetical protein